MNNVYSDGDRLFCGSCAAAEGIRGRERFHLTDFIFCDECGKSLQTQKDFIAHIGHVVENLLAEGEPEEGITETEKEPDGDILKHLVRSAEVRCEHSKKIIGKFEAHLFYRTSGMTFILCFSVEKLGIVLTFRTNPVGVIAEKIFAIL